jgi:hypothetical protein
MSGHDDFEFEPSPGIPAPLPQGEQLLWQGRPDWKRLAISAYHVRKVALYFVALVIWRIASGVREGHQPAAVLLSCAWILCLGAVACGVLSLLAYLSARMAVYSITSERVLLRHGIAVPMTVNVPYSLIESAALKADSKGGGDVVMSISASQRLGYIITWPYLRPGRITRPELSFRALDNPAAAAEVLARAVAAHSGSAVRVGAANATPELSAADVGGGRRSVAAA